MQESAALTVRAAQSGRWPRFPTAARAALVYAALHIFLCGMTGAGFFPLAFALGSALSAYAKKRRLHAWALVFSALALLLALPSARNGACLLLNRLFARSEAVNRYRYAYLPAAANIGAEKAAFYLLSCVLAGFASLSSGCAPLIWALALAGAEAFFGVTPGDAANLLAFALLAVSALGGARAPTLLAAALLLIGLSAALLFPGAHQKTEALSEQVRDRLSNASALSGAQLAQESAYSLTRRETRLYEAPAASEGDNAPSAREYEQRMAYQKDISLPNRVDYFKIALIALGVVLLFLAPFLPFALIDRRRKAALAGRADFDASDNRAAVLSMFRHIACCLRRDGANVNYSALCASADLPEEYASHYLSAARIWQEAAYSRHEITRQQRNTVQELLKETHRLIWARAGFRERLRLQYVSCLILPEDIEHDEKNS